MKDEEINRIVDENDTTEWLVFQLPATVDEHLSELHARLNTQLDTIIALQNRVTILEQKLAYDRGQRND